MATSANGYVVLFDNRTSGDLPRLRKWSLNLDDDTASERHFYVRDGSTGFLLIHLALWFHDRVERLDLGQWDEWGWAVRPVRGQDSGYSNHASGTAVDLNATRHPMGVSIYRTFTAEQIRQIRMRMEMLDGVIRWGGEWSRPDGMHFEIAAPIDVCERKARRLMGTPRGEQILQFNQGARQVILS